MRKSKKKKVEIEENEFLKGLIDEVKAYDEKAAPDPSDDSLVDFENVIYTRTKAETKESRARGIFEATKTQVQSKSDSSGDDDLPTAFVDLGKAFNNDDIKAPSLNSLTDSDELPEIDGQAISVPDSIPVISDDDSPSEIQLSEDQSWPLKQESVSSSGEATVAVQASESSSKGGTAEDTRTQLSRPEGTVNTIGMQEADRTVAVAGARGRPGGLLQEKVVSGSLKGTRSGHVYISPDASLAQSETLKLAQERIQELEKEVDRLRQENDDLVSASDVVTQRMEELQIKVVKADKERIEQTQQAKSEILILKGRLQYKDSELSKSKAKIENLEMRLKSDFRKIRVRERELENRLELVRAEKQALMRSKDENILDLQRKLDQFKSELDLYRAKVQDLNKSMEEQQEQMRNTVRALRVALSNLEHDEMTNIILGEAEASIGESVSTDDSGDSGQEDAS